ADAGGRDPGQRPGRERGLARGNRKVRIGARGDRPARRAGARGDGRVPQFPRPPRRLGGGRRATSRGGSRLGSSVVIWLADDRCVATVRTAILVLRGARFAGSSG